MGSTLPDVRQGPFLDVPAPHVQRSVFRTTPHKTVDLSSRSPEGALRVCVVGSLLGHRDPLLCGVNYRAWNMTTSTTPKPITSEERVDLTIMALVPGFCEYMAAERR